MKIHCDTIRDLMPLYIEGLLSEKSVELVNQHIVDCRECEDLLEKMKQPDIEISHNIDMMKSFKKSLRKHTISIISTTIFCIIASIILIWGLFFLSPGDELGYTFLCFYLFLPISAFVCTWVVGKRTDTVTWWIPILFGIIGGILPYVIYHSLDEVFVVFAFIPSVIALFLSKVTK